MVLDPLTAFSVAGTVIQLVDFSFKIFAKSRQIHESAEGATETNQQLADSAQDLRNLVTKLGRPLRPAGNPGNLSENEKRLQELCIACSEIAQSMIDRLNQLKHPGKRKAWNSFQQAIKVAWSQDEMRNWSAKLSAYKEAIQMHILVGLRKDIDAMSLQLSERFDSLTANSQLIINALLTNDASNNEMDLRDQNIALARLLDRTELVITDAENRNRSIIVDTVREAILDSFRSSNVVAEFDGDIKSTFERVQYVQTEEERARKMVENAILGSLKFSTMTERQEEIAAAHAKTFDWIFEERQRGWPGADFVSWLLSDQGVYWINGKAGSGKSTLMRYLSKHAKIHQLLGQWAGDLPITIASFYFWNGGSPMQRSQAGLFRAIISEVLEQHRGLIPILLPGAWARAYSLLPWYGPRAGYSDSWTTLDNVAVVFEESWPLAKIIHVFWAIITQQVIPMRLFFLIDGLDEYEGSYSELAKLFGEVISSSKNAKACLSSRPLLVFEDAFKECPNLRLQDLTYEDIQRYVTDQLEKNQRYLNLAVKEPFRAPRLVQEIVTKADGVFLWVTLVVRSLLNGLENRDTISDLQRRLRLLPADLEDLYKLMMKRIDPFYLSKASETLQILRAVQRVRDNIGALEDPDNNGALTILELALVDFENTDLVVTSQIAPISGPEVAIRCSEMSDRLKPRCAGLVEVHGLTYHSAGQYPTPRPMSKVQYLHRTVQDYFLKPDIWNTVLSWKADEDYNPHASLLKAYVLYAKIIPCSQIIKMRSLDIGSRALGHAYYAYQHTRQPRIELLDQFDQTMASHLADQLKRSKCHWISEQSRRFFDHSTFLTFAVRYGLSAYVDTKLGQLKRNKAGDMASYLLRFATNSVTARLDYITPISPEVVEVLLKHVAKASKNQELRATLSLVWGDALLDAVRCLNSTRSSENLARMILRIKLMVQYGANVDFHLFVPIKEDQSIVFPQPCTVSDIVKIGYGPRIPKEAAEFEKFLNSRKLEEVCPPKKRKFWRRLVSST